jgi:protein-S-isoprenylcysteine O-methyltransferase Ste14
MDNSVDPFGALLTVWAIWLISWLGASMWSDRTQARPILGSQFLYRFLSFVGAATLFDYRHWGPAQLWDLGDAGDWAVVGLAIAGFLFCWWARLHLGRLWSSSVTRKADHHIVDTGPYRLVRHPIYTGLIIAAFATVLQRGTAVSAAGFAILTFSFWIKARLEEKFLRSELGTEAYDDYAGRTGMLLPFL